MIIGAGFKRESALTIKQELGTRKNRRKDWTPVPSVSTGINLGHERPSYSGQLSSKPNKWQLEPRWTV